MFIRSSVDEVEGGMVAVREGSKYRVESYQRRPNRPVNLDYVITFHPDTRFFREGVSACPVISFTLPDSTLYWFYPPTDEGKKIRDKDLAQLHLGFCEKLKSFEDGPEVPVPPAPEVLRVPEKHFL